MEGTQIQPAPETTLEPLRLGEILLRKARLSETALEEALTQQREKGGRIGEVVQIASEGEQAKPGGGGVWPLLRHGPSGG